MRADYEHEGYLEAMYHLKLLQSEGKIKHLAVRALTVQLRNMCTDNPPVAHKL
jgi:hypothetical protein